MVLVGFQEDFKQLHYIDDNGLSAYNISNTGVYISFLHYGGNDTLGHPTYDTDTSTTVQYVTAGYKGYLTDRTIFNQTAEGETVEFTLKGVIPGWQIAIPEMSIGDSAVILIPSYWGYGHYGVSPIPGDAVLVFDVFLDSHERK
ncbi:MAG: FKBP-type peptidyl-prolyl cis-trans isomerase [Bacteroidales bacterium]|jgi:FKBP-type peptidyl-prolyl cis-trans isomerase|nr:FKBP-type peptidyl-prolyl cis-trans isomerase [Bacteroidales bacterium]